MKKYFYNPNDASNAAQLAAIRTWLTAYFQKNGVDTGGGAFSENLDFELTVEEQHCGASGCLHTETLLAVSFYDEAENLKKMYFRIKKPLVFIRKFDFEQLQSVDSPQSGAHRH